MALVREFLFRDDDITGRERIDSLQTAKPAGRIKS